MPKQAVPKISLIIAAKGAKDTIESCLKSALSIDYPNYDVILVNDGLDKSALQIVEQYQDQITVLQNSGFGPSMARNYGVRHSDAEFVAFIDADCIIDQSCFNEFMHAFNKCPDAVGCGGIQIVPDDATAFQRDVYSFMTKVGLLTDYVRSSKEKAIRFVNHNASCNVIYRREPFLKIGSFCEGMWPGEDLELDYRLKMAGHTLLFNSRAKVYHYRVKTYSALIRMMFRYGFAQGILVRMYGVFRPLQFIPFILTLLLCLAGFLLFITPLFLIPVVMTGLGLIFLWSCFNIRVMMLMLSGPLSWYVGFWKGLFRKL